MDGFERETCTQKIKWKGYCKLNLLQQITTPQSSPSELELQATAF